MDLSTLPVFDFDTPWVSLIQLGLFFLNPQLTGHFTDKLTNAKVKIAILGGLSLLGVVLTHLLDYAIADSWSQFDSTEFSGIVINFVFAWFLSQFAFDKILKPTGASAAAQESNILKFVGPSPERVAAARLAA